MSVPQPGLLVLGATEHAHVEFRVKPGVSTDQLREALAKTRAAVSWLPGPNVTFGFRPALWQRLGAGGLPADLADFTGIQGSDGRQAPATQFDIWIWCSGSDREPVDKTAELAIEALARVADPAERLDAHVTSDSRDPTGFIDGTENPLLDEASEVALYPADSPAANGSAVLVQKWVHNMAAFEALPVVEQERVIGRTKPDSIELAEDVMPATSHVSRNTVLDAAGEEMHIFRRNTPYINDKEAGTLFIGCSNRPSLVLDMLERMFGATSDGLHDRLVEFSTAVTGSWYFVPALNVLSEVFGEIADAEGEDETATLSEPADGPASSDGSLGIGSLLGISSRPTAED